MSADESKKYRSVLNTLDSGYGTDSVPSPMSAGYAAKPVFFGEDDNQFREETCDNAGAQGDNSINAKDIPSESSGGHEITEVKHGMAQLGVDGYDVDQNVLKADGTELPNISNNCNIVGSVDELADELEGRISLNSEAIITDENEEDNSNAVSVVPVVPSASQPCVQMMIASKQRYQISRPSDESGSPLRRSASLPDMQTLRIRNVQEMGRRLRRMSDEFYYLVLYRRTCQACSQIRRNVEVTSFGPFGDNT